jgi:hypothetical protein
MVQDARDDTGSPALDDVTLAFTGMAIIAGLLIGASGPIFVIFIGPGLVAGPTWGGLVLFLAIAVAGLSGLAALIAAFALWHGARYFGRVCLISVALVGGIFGGTALGRATQAGRWLGAGADGCPVALVEHADRGSRVPVGERRGDARARGCPRVQSDHTRAIR